MNLETAKIRLLMAEIDFLRAKARVLESELEIRRANLAKVQEEKSINADPRRWRGVNQKAGI